VVFDAQGRNGSGALLDALRAAQFLGACTPFRVFGMLRALFRHLCRRPVGGLARSGPPGKRKHPTPPSKFTTELDADQSSFSKLFLGAIDLMNPQKHCPRCDGPK